MTTKNICVITSGTMTNSIDLYLQGIKKRCEALGYFCTVFSMLKFDRLELGDQMKVYSLIDFSQYCGVIYLETAFAAHKSCGSTIEEHLKKRCPLPVVVIGESEQGYPQIDNETKEPFQMLVNHLIEEHDCKTIYCLGGTKMRRSGRIEGYVEAMESHNLLCPPEYIFYGGFWKECAEALAKKIVHGTVEKPDAVACVTDHVAYQLTKSLMEYGYRVPEDIRICGFSGLECVYNKAMTLTTCSLDFKESGSMAVTMIDEQLTGDRTQSAPKKKPHLVLGATCGCNQLSVSERRMLLESLDREELCEMFFENSGIDAAFLNSSSVQDVINTVKRLNYLVPDKRLFAITLYHGADLWCHYISNLLEDTNPAPIKGGKLLPSRINYMEECDNLTVVPLPFENQILGYALIGYKEPRGYDKYLVRFLDQVITGLRMVSGTGKQSDVGVVEQPVKQEYIFVKHEDSLQKLALEMVYYFEAVNKHVYAVTKNGSYEIGKKLYELEDEMDANTFIRISKSQILNIGKISSLHIKPNRTIEVFLLNKSLVHVSRNYSEKFLEKVRV